MFILKSGAGGARYAVLKPSSLRSVMPVPVETCVGLACIVSIILSQMPFSQSYDLLF